MNRQGATREGEERRHHRQRRQSALPKNLRSPPAAGRSRSTDQAGRGLLHSAAFGGEPSAVARLTANRPVHLFPPAGGHNLCQTAGRGGDDPPARPPRCQPEQAGGQSPGTRRRGRGPAPSRTPPPHPHPQTRACAGSDKDRGRPETMRLPDSAVVRAGVVADGWVLADGGGWRWGISFSPAGQAKVKKGVGRRSFARSAFSTNAPLINFAGRGRRGGFVEAEPRKRIQFFFFFFSPVGGHGERGTKRGSCAGQATWASGERQGCAESRDNFADLLPLYRWRPAKPRRPRREGELTGGEGTIHYGNSL